MDIKPLTQDAALIQAILTQLEAEGIVNLYQGAPDTTSFRLNRSGIVLHFERYNGVGWDSQGSFGGSLTVPRFVELIKDANADLLVVDGDSVRNLARSASFSLGSVFGDTEGESFIVTEGGLFKVMPLEAKSWKTLQPNASQNSVGTSFYVDNTTTPVQGFVAEKIKVKPVGMGGGVTAQLKIYRQSDLAKPVWENITDAELEAGSGAPVDNVSGEITLKPRFFGIGNTDIRLVVNFSESVTLQGSTAGGDDIYFESFDATVAFFELETANIGEVKQFALSMTNAVTKELLQFKGWAVCDGTTPASQGIADPIITTTPNLTHKFIRMSNDESSGATGGADTHALTVAEMPEHTHDMECSLSAGTEATVRCGGTNGETVTTSATGSGEAHNNLPSYYELVNFIRVR